MKEALWLAVVKKTKSYQEGIKKDINSKNKKKKQEPPWKKRNQMEVFSGKLKPF